MRKKLLLLFLFLFGLFNVINAQWTIKNIDEPSFSYDNIIKFKNDSLGFFMGNNSVILKSNDTGETWNVINLETKVNIKDFQFIDDTIIYAVGDYYIGSGEYLTSKLIISRDNGDTWDSLVSFKGKQLYSLWFFNSDSGMLAGYDAIFRTVDSGDSWDTVWSITKFGYQYGELKQLIFSTSQIGYEIGMGRNQHNNPNFDHFSLKSNDAGLTWDTIKTFQYPLTTIHFMNQDTGFIGTESSSSIILKTTDGGDTWNETQVAHYYNSVNSIHFTSNMTGFAAGSPSAFIPEGPTSFFISKTINGGVTWESYDTIGIPLNSIYYINDTIGFVSGSYSLIMKSSGKINGLPENYPWHLVGGGVYIDESESDKSQIKIYPNPTNGILYIQPYNLTQDIKSIKLISTAGYVMDIMEPLTDNDLITIDLSDLTPGIYLIQVIYSDRNELLKALKK